MKLVAIVALPLRALAAICCAYERAMDHVPLPWIQAVDDLGWWCAETAKRIAPTAREIEQDRIFEEFMKRAR